MVEAETVTVGGGLSVILELIEGLYKSTVEAVLKRNSDDVKLFHDHIAAPDIKVEHIIFMQFRNLCYLGITLVPWVSLP